MSKISWPTERIGKISFDEVDAKIERAVRLLLENDYFLLDSKANERSVTHKLAEYLQDEFPQWHVDCEYNRRLVKIKEIKGRKVIPDIIIHRRNTNNNLLVIELKCFNNDGQEDREKLKEFTNKNGKFKYVYGLFLRLNKDSVEKIWYQNGQQKN